MFFRSDTQMSIPPWAPGPTRLDAMYSRRPSSDENGQPSEAGGGAFISASGAAGDHGPKLPWCASAVVASPSTRATEVISTPLMAASPVR